mgnify:CR=1 FL=1
MTRIKRLIVYFFLGQMYTIMQKENILFSDNRTDQFDLAGPVKRRLLVTANWGSEMPIVPVSTPVVYLRRIRVAGQRLWWRLLGSWLILR